MKIHKKYLDLRLKVERQLTYVFHFSIEADFENLQHLPFSQSRTQQLAYSPVLSHCDLEYLLCLTFQIWTM